MADFKLNIDPRLTAASLGPMARATLYDMRPSQQNPQAPSWDGQGSAIAARNVSTPITDKSIWMGRYALIELTLVKEDGTALILNDVVVSLNLSKVIVTTQQNNFNGTIKEAISTGDYDITFNVGVLAAENGVTVDEYPEEQMRELVSFLTINERVKAVSTFLDIFDIEHIVITGFSVRQQTESNRQTIEIKALSDYQYEIAGLEY